MTFFFEGLNTLVPHLKAYSEIVVDKRFQLFPERTSTSRKKIVFTSKKTSWEYSFHVEYRGVSSTYDVGD